MCDLTAGQFTVSIVFRLYTKVEDVFLNLQRGESMKARITPKQTEVLLYLRQGLQNKEIAQKMGVSLAAVKQSLQGLYQRLHVNSRLCALIKAQELGLIELRNTDEDVAE